MSSESSAEVQKEAETERAELASTLDKLRENLKPANVMDEVMANAKVTTSEVSDRVVQIARNHPIPAVLIGLGAAMLMGAGQVVRSRSAARDHDWSDDSRFPKPGSQTPPYDSGNGGRGWSPSAVASRVGEAAGSARTRLSSQLDTLGSKASASASRLADSAASLRTQAVSTASSYATSARDAVSGDAIMNQNSRSRGQATGSVARLIDEQPLVLAALGIAVGAAIGAAIPATDTEARLMGDASASFKSRAQELAQAEYQHLKQTASSTLDELKQSAAEHGVSTDNVSDLVQDAKSKVRDAANNVADHAAGSAGVNS